MLLLQIYIKFNMDSRYSLESMWSPGGVQHRESSGITGTPHGFHMDSTRTPGTFWLCPRQPKCTWSPGGVPLESRWSTGSPQESTRNVWGSVKTSNCLTSTVMILHSPILVVQYCSLENLFNPFELCDVCEHFK